MANSLHIQQQPRLPLHKQVEICADGIHHRLFRATLTLSIIVLAIAFLMNILTESVIARACKLQVFEQSAQIRQLNRFDAYFQGPVDVEILRKRIIAASPDTWRHSAMMHWLQIDSTAFDALRNDTVAADRYLQWFASLSMGHRRILVGNLTEHESMVHLSDQQKHESFSEGVMQIPSLAVPEGLLDFALRYPAYHERVTQLLPQINSELKQLDTALDGNPFSSLFAASVESTDAREKLTALLAQQNIKLTDEQFNTLQDQAAHARKAQQVAQLLNQPKLSSAWQSEFNEIYETETVYPILASDPSRIDWLINQSGRDDLDRNQSGRDDLDRSALQQTIKRLHNEKQISQTEEQLAAGYGREEGIGERVFWLIVVSLLVCIVGIANAMLVSVLERFREIATMKCLGALDGFIAVLFLLEAAFLGLTGGLAGVLIGFVIGFGRMAWGYGDWVYSSFPAVDLLIAAVASVVTGLLLATFAAIYPAWMASRMPPMEAMRVE